MSEYTDKEIELYYNLLNIQNSFQDLHLRVTGFIVNEIRDNRKLPQEEVDKLINSLSKFRRNVGKIQIPRKIRILNKLGDKNGNKE